jgi:hypothetical protein
MQTRNNTGYASRRIANLRVHSDQIHEGPAKLKRNNYPETKIKTLEMEFHNTTGFLFNMLYNNGRHRRITIHRDNLVSANPTFSLSDL